MSTTLQTPRAAVARSKGRTRSVKAASHKRPWWHRWLRRFFIAASICLFLMIAAVAGAITWAWNTMDLPADTPLAQTSFIMDANGNQLASFAAQNRVEVPLTNVPTVLRQAVLDTEDHDYYKHHGVDPRGVMRALWNDLTNKSGLQGGSTITQQYVKTEYVGNKRTPTRKFKEAILAIKLDRKYSKDDILDRYLNTIYFGRGAYGVQTASQAYFGKDVQQITLPQAAYLAGLIRAPELADAYSAPDVATQRRDVTLDRMEHYGDITHQQLVDVENQKLQSYVIPKSQSISNTNSDHGSQYFVDYVRQILVARYGEAKVLKGGLQVTTTLDQTMQNAAYDSVYGTLNRASDPSGSLVTLGQDGQIKAMVGGRDWNQSQVNLAVGSTGGGSGRQAGSTFKAVALAAYLEDGGSLYDTYSGPPRLTLNDEGTVWNVANFGDESFGPIPVLEATQESVNTVYAQIAKKVGSPRIAEMAKELGIESPLGTPVPSLVLGVAPVSALDMADAYLTFSQGGVHVTPNPIMEVKDASGNVLEHFKPQRKRVISEQTANQVTYALQQVVLHGTGTAAQIGKPIAGKTGTTDDSADAWFVGYTPTMATALWMGFPESEKHKLINVHGIGQVTGGTLPAQMWSKYMRIATANDPATPFPQVSLSKSGTTLPLGVGQSTTTTASTKTDQSTSSTVPETSTSTTVSNTSTTTVVSPNTSTTVPTTDGGGHIGLPIHPRR